VATPFTLGWYAGDSASFDAAQVNGLPARPQVVNYYSGWGEGFNTTFARAAYADGVQTFVELEPWNCASCQVSQPPLSAIAAGDYDGYLLEFGAEIRAFGHPVLATFAHEMNARWYPWGEGGQEGATAAQWVAAWDHVVTVINSAAPGLVRWVWAPAAESPWAGAGSVAAYWPGAQYVNIVGVDGYLNSAQDTYQSVFAQTVTDIRALTSSPIWIAETGVTPASPARLAAYISALRAAGLTGFLYFNERSWQLSPAEEQSLATAIG
jgi:beta-mannanase